MTPRKPAKSTRKAPKATPRKVAQPKGPPVPPDELADLTDAQQVEMIRSTDNGLPPADAKLPQPGPDYVPPDA